ncbi:MAG TPA: rhodanese-like domain-containing protein [Anaerolineae bacterium]|nr:rhodanese-like domain-containing protein [Anaerolineae bacterium]
MPEDLSNKSAGHCAQCGAALRAGAQFCTTCGAPAAGASPSSAGPATGSKRSRTWLAVGAVVLLLAVVAAGLVWFNDSQQPAPTVAVAIPTAPMAGQDIPFPNVARVAVEQAHMSAMSGDALIVDVRDREFYDTSHIRGSLSLPSSELPARLAELPQDKTILTYCT